MFRNISSRGLCVSGSRVDSQGKPTTIFPPPDQVTFQGKCRFGCVVNESSNIAGTSMKYAFMWNKQTIQKTDGIFASTTSPANIFWFVSQICWILKYITKTLAPDNNSDSLSFMAASIHKCLITAICWTVMVWREKDATQKVPECSSMCEKWESLVVPEILFQSLQEPCLKESPARVLLKPNSALRWFKSSLC